MKKNKSRKKTKKAASRRKFLGGAAASGALLTQACTIVPRHVLGGKGYIAPSEKLNIASIGAGGKGRSDTANSARTENIIALCDVDQRRAAQTFRRFPDVARYTDYRVMLDERDDIDAVTVSTPDHTHASATLLAIEKGIHVYCQKPLTHDIHEARLIRDAARKHGVVTQMGNQGSASTGLRRAVEIIQSGGIGRVREAHVWTNRPTWPQAMYRPEEEQPVPAALEWDLWLGTAPERPYHEAYLPHNWRGWYDYGTGALGDMGCHTANLPFMALKLGSPTSVVATSSAIFSETYPSWCEIKFEFPARGDMPPVTFTWHDGGKRPHDDLFLGSSISRSGSMMIGDRGTLYSPGDRDSENDDALILLPEKEFADFEDPPQTLPRSPGHHQEWIMACKGEDITPMSNFEYAAFLTETILLGNLALRLGHKIEWDGRLLMAKNCSEAAGLIQREYRTGYSAMAE